MFHFHKRTGENQRNKRKIDREEKRMKAFDSNPRSPDYEESAVPLVPQPQLPQTRETKILFSK